MKESRLQNETNQTSETKETKETLVRFTIPLRVSAEDIIRALGVLADKGGEVRFHEISQMFGPKKSHRDILSGSLGAAVAFDLIKPHSGKAPYILSSFGKRFLTATEEQRKSMLLRKFLKFEGYKDVLVQMKNKSDKQLKKEVITNVWLNVAEKKLPTRKLYTRTFASVGKWCGAIQDSGQTCSLTDEGLEILSQILKGEEAKPLGPPTGPPKVPPTGLSFQVTHCPHCGKAEFDIENEELLNTVVTNGTNTLIIKYTFYCRGCSREFSRIGQHTIAAAD